MYERLKRLYGNGEVTENGLLGAVRRGWITEEQKQEIIAGDGEE